MHRFEKRAQVKIRLLGGKGGGEKIRPAAENGLTGSPRGNGVSTGKKTRQNNKTRWSTEWNVLNTPSWHAERTTGKRAIRKEGMEGTGRGGESGPEPSQGLPGERTCL